MKRNILDSLDLPNENPDEFLFYRKLELSNTNFNLIQILNSKEELRKEVYMSCISNGVKIFVEKKEYLNDDEKMENKESDFIQGKIFIFFNTFFHRKN